MHLESVATPFGRRSMTLGMLETQYRTNKIAPNQSVDKWKIFRAVCEAKPLLGLSDRALAVLNALLSFYPGNELGAEHGLVVFPSNAQLSLRAHGIAPATLRRHLAALIEAGLLVRKDSPNGKRFARRDGEGQVNQAYGFSIAPLIARAKEISALAAQVGADRLLFRETKERLSLCRRDIAKLIETALEEGIEGEWATAHTHFRTVVAQIPRSPSLIQLAFMLSKMEILRNDVLNLLETHLNIKNMTGSESQTERHIQNTKPDSNFELEANWKAEQPESEKSATPTTKTSVGSPDDITTSPGPYQNHADNRVNRAVQSHAGKNSYTLGFVLKACPEITAYGPQGSVQSWRDLMAAAVVVRSMLGVTPSAYEAACRTMGPENAAMVMACVLERAGTISSAGGYLRDLTRRAARGEFAIGSMLMALTRGHGNKGTGAGSCRA